MRKALLIAIVFSICAVSGGVGEPEQESPPEVLTRLYADLYPVFRQYYPMVSARRDCNGMEFAHDTRTFAVHTRLKTGEWQDAQEVRGPNRGGILCSISLHKGRFEGALALPGLPDDSLIPQFSARPDFSSYPYFPRFSGPYFQTMLIVFAAPDESRYLYGHLHLPDGVEPGFLEEFMEKVKGAWVDRKNVPSQTEALKPPGDPEGRG